MNEKLAPERFSKEGTIRFAKKQDIPRIMEFIGAHWAKNHILSRDRELFEFQYVYGDEVCFVLDEDAERGELTGVLGYIPYGTEGERDIFTAIWKVIGGAGFMQGTELICYLEKYGRCKNLYCVGLASRVVSIMKYLRKQILDYEHYYLLNPTVSDYQVAQIPREVSERLQAAVLPMEEMRSEAAEQQVGKASTGVKSEQRFGCRLASGKEVCWERVTEFARISDLLADAGNRFPYKTPAYVNRRYFQHPEYDYEAWRLQMEGKEALLICRVTKAPGGVVYRVIDLLGELSCMEGCGALLRSVLLERGYEYADCLVCGIEEKLMMESGFSKKQEGDGCILPNYFEPFVAENIVIHNFMPRGVPGVMFKGDGDQDRPNFRKKENGCKS